jgi:hypothetical protein
VHGRYGAPLPPDLHATSHLGAVGSARPATREKKVMTCAPHGVAAGVFSPSRHNLTFSPTSNRYSLKLGSERRIIVWQCMVKMLRAAAAERAG